MIIIREATEKNIPYDLVSSLAILRDYDVIEDSDYVNEEHKLLVDIADSLFNVGASVANNFKAEYKEVYDKYGKSYFNKVLKDMRALDSQIESGNVNDLIDEINDKLASFGGIYESYMIHEQDVEIEVKHEGILEVPEGKNVDDLPISHFEKLVKKNGLSKITKALNNLQVWNKNDDKKLSKWAGDMIDKLTKKYGKNESFIKESGMYDYYDTPDNVFDMHNDMPTEEDEKNKVYKHYITVSGNIIEDFAKFVSKYFNEKFEDVVNNDSKTIWMDDFDSSGNKYIVIMCTDSQYKDIRNWVRQNSHLNLRTESKRMFKENMFKSYWKYNVEDPILYKHDNEYDDTYLTKYDIRKVKLIPCETPEECYNDDNYYAVCNYEYPYKEFYGTKQEAYDMLLTSWNNSTFERIHDI